MAIADDVLQALSALETHLVVLTSVSRADELVSAANNYLASWPRARIENLQKFDGGWGTFDPHGRPDVISDPADIVGIAHVLNSQCAALKAAGIQPAIELLELELYFAVGKHMAEAFIAAKSSSKAGKHPKARYRHWSDNSAVAA